MTESSREKLLEAILHSYLQAVDAGQNPDREELLQRHPEIADELRGFFADQSRMDRLAKSLKTAAYVTSRPQPAFQAPTPAELADKFPQLEILELLGQGGMGAVYKARQKGLDRDVALKILPPDAGGNASFAERFSREAKALAKLSHPNIVTVFEFGQTSDGLCYFVMEYIDGVNLRQALRAGKMSPKEALAIVPQICDALQFAHDEGIVHRDIKPENVLLDKKGRVKIADFGLAKLLGGSDVDPSLTGTQQVMGTLRYMAPEQMEGSKLVDHRADIYSLGVVFYELLTGEVPMGRFAPPSKKVQIDVRLDEVVLRALEREPEQRWQQASDVKTEMAAITSNSDVNRQKEESPSQQELEAQVIELLRQDKLAAAIKLFADVRKVSLGKAREAVNTIGNLHGIERPNALTQRYAGQIAILSLALAVFLVWLPQRDNPGLLDGVASAGAIIVYLGWLAGIWITVRRNRQGQATISFGRWTTVGVAFLISLIALLCYNLPYWNLPPNPAPWIAGGCFLALNFSMAMWATAFSLRAWWQAEISPERRVRGPAIGMIVIASLGAGVCLVGAIVTGVYLWAGNTGPNSEPVLRAILVASLVGLPIRIATVYGAISLLGLRGRGWALTSSVLMILPTDPLAIFGIPLGLWALLTLLRADVSAILSQRESSPNSGASSPSKPVGTPLKNIRFLADESCDVGQQANFHFLALGYRLIEQGPGRWTFERGSWLAGLWATNIRDLYTRLTVQIIPAPEQKQWVSCDWSVKTWQSIITRWDIRKLDEEGEGFRLLLGGVKPAETVEEEKQAETSGANRAVITRFLAAAFLVGMVFLGVNATIGFAEAAAWASLAWLAVHGLLFLWLPRSTARPALLTSWTLACAAVYCTLWLPTHNGPHSSTWASALGYFDRHYWPYEGKAKCVVTLTPKHELIRRITITNEREIRRDGYASRGVINWTGPGWAGERTRDDFSIFMEHARGHISILEVDSKGFLHRYAGSALRWPHDRPLTVGDLEDWVLKDPNQPANRVVPKGEESLRKQCEALMNLIRLAKSDDDAAGGWKGEQKPVGYLAFFVGREELDANAKGTPFLWADYVGTHESSFAPVVSILYVGVPIMLALWLGGLLVIQLLNRASSSAWSESWRALPAGVRLAVHVPLVLFYLASVWCLFGYNFSISRSPDNPATSAHYFAIGNPGPWFVRQTTAGTATISVHLFTGSVLAGILGLAALWAMRRLEVAERGKVHSLRWHYGLWIFMLLLAVGMGIFSSVMHDRKQAVPKDAPPANPAENDHKAARGVCEQFLQAIVDNQLPAALLLTTPQFKAMAAKANDHPNAADPVWNGLNRLIVGPPVLGEPSFPKFTQWKLEKVTGSANEVYCKGQLLADRHLGAFDITVIKPDSEPGWRVHFMTVRRSFRPGEYPFWDHEETIAAYAKRAGLAPAESLDLGKGVKLELALIPAGMFVMGAADNEAKADELVDTKWELPRRIVVHKRPFYMGKYEVTQSQWLAVMGKAPKFRLTFEAEKDPKKFGNHPAEDMTFAECNDFCKQASALTKRAIRLPSEAEWEYACRAGTTTYFFFGDETQKKVKGNLSNFVLKEYLQFGAKAPYEVGTRRPNPWGLYDLLGNVAERVADVEHLDYQGAPTDGSAWTTGGDPSRTVVRGGSWEDAGPLHCRSAARCNFPSVNLHSNTLGLRVVVEVDHPKGK